MKKKKKIVFSFQFYECAAFQLMKKRRQKSGANTIFISLNNHVFSGSANGMFHPYFYWNDSLFARKYRYMINKHPWWHNSIVSHFSRISIMIDGRSSFALFLHTMACLNFFLLKKIKSLEHGVIGTTLALCSWIWFTATMNCQRNISVALLWNTKYIFIAAQLRLVQRANCV